MKKKICILGSTGNIGKSTLDIISENKKDFEVVLLSGNQNYKLLISQAIKFKPKFIYSNNFFLTKKISTFCKKKKIIIINDLNLLKNIKFDITISAISGIAGLTPTLNIIKFSKKILIANKESIICAWKFISRELKKNNSKFIPIDSEHFSIFNLIENKNTNAIHKIYLTASGGPFFNKKINLNNVSIEQAVKHPIWKMGKKISVDSANLMNKVLEIIEASLLFNLSLNKFAIAIHPKSLVHAIVQYKNGLSFFSYHKPNMKIPIINSLYENFDNKKFFNENFFNKNSVETKLFFFKPCLNNYPALHVLKIAKKYGVKSYLIINVLNELLIKKFLEKKILFPDIINKLLLIMRSKQIKNHLKNNKIKHINDVFKTYNFCKGILK